jgi:hypothetical protein
MYTCCLQLLTQYDIRFHGGALQRHGPHAPDLEDLAQRVQHLAIGSAHEAQLMHTHVMGCDEAM